MKLVALVLILASACDKKADVPAQAKGAHPASIPDASVALLDQYATGAHDLAARVGARDCANALPAVKALTPVAAKILVDTDALDKLSTSDPAALAWLSTTYKDKLAIATNDILTAVKSGTCMEEPAFKASVIDLSVAMGATPPK